MKKTAKIILIVCCAALFLFLLLPFLETQAPRTGKTEDTAKTEPQIFTSNPLTELVGRIARFFKGRGSEQRREAGTRPMTNEETAELFGQPQEGTLYASAATASNETSSQTLAAGSGAYADAYLQNEEGEWVLIRQTSPEGASRGMHEINVKENAYERYVQQERQARFTPVMRHPKTAEVPDSKLARVFNPIKRLFGFGEDSAASASLASWNDDFAAGKLASSSGLDRNGEKTSKLPKTRPVNWNGFRNNPFSSMEPGGVEAAEAFLDLINPMRAIGKSAEWLANIKYPRTDTPEQEQEKADWIDAKQNAEREQMHQEIQELLVRQSNGENSKNIIQDVVNPFSCGDGSVTKNKCKKYPTPDIPAIQERSKIQFKEETGVDLPPAGVAVVLNATTLPLIDEDSAAELEEMTGDNSDEPLSPEEKQKSKDLEFYQFMQEKCQDCYWVATNADADSELAQTIEAVGLTLKGDPYNRYDQYVDAYLKEQKQNGKTDKEIKEMQQQLTQHKTAYTAYSLQDMQQMHQDTLALLGDENATPEQGAVPFFTHVQNAYGYYQQLENKHPLLYGQGSMVNGNQELEERAQNLTGELIQFVNDAKEIRRKMEQSNTEEGTQELVKPKIQQVQEQLKQEMQNFTENNDLGRTQK